MQRRYLAAFVSDKGLHLHLVHSLSHFYMQKSSLHSSPMQMHTSHEIASFRLSIKYLLLCLQNMRL